MWSSWAPETSLRFVNLTSVSLTGATSFGAEMQQHSPLFRNTCSKLPRQHRLLKYSAGIPRSGSMPSPTAFMPMGASTLQMTSEWLLWDVRAIISRLFPRFIRTMNSATASRERTVAIRRVQLLSATFSPR